MGSERIVEGSSAFSPSRPYPLPRVRQWDIEADVIVVGFGAAGACAAIEAADAGDRKSVV